MEEYYLLGRDGTVPKLKAMTVIEDRFMGRKDRGGKREGTVSKSK